LTKVRHHVIYHRRATTSRPERELTRKKYLVSLENRTPEQLLEEEALYIEVKRLEQHERRFKRDRDELLRTLAGIDSGLPDVIEDENLMNLVIDVKKKKKGGYGMDIDSPSTPLLANSPMIKRPQSAKSAAYGISTTQLFALNSLTHEFLKDAANCIIRTDPPSTTPVTKAAHQPAYLRSSKLPSPKAAIAPKVTAALAELGISHTRLVMPTRDNTAQLESLLDATSVLVDTKRQVDKIEYDINVLKTRLGMRESSAAADEGGIHMSEVMDVDENNEGNDGDTTNDGRAQSVVSTRSARSRKHVCFIIDLQVGRR
jgi:DNA methyltransferase 1-associated protein 1